tara:strand:+ start:397 stop:564 length:168 start_codon:yes stop_codon:yes gene_type:complete
MTGAAIKNRQNSDILSATTPVCHARGGQLVYKPDHTGIKQDFDGHHLEDQQSLES